jgi:predicted nucleic acid-binding protein
MREEGLFHLAVSAPITMEVEHILAEKFLWPQERLREAATYLWSLAHSFSTQQLVNDCSDPDDNRILRVRAGRHAAVIVTGDGHLLRLHPYRGTEILTAKQLLELKRWEER